MQISISNAIGGGGGTQGGGTPTPPPFSNVNSFSFDGIDDYFIGTSTYSELDAANKLTISFWAKSTNAVLSIPVQVGTGSNRQFYIAISNSGRITFKKNINTDNTGIRADNGTPHDGNWNHIMICMDLTATASLKGDIFFNGVNVTHSRTLDTNAIQTSTGDLNINEANKDFTGKIDELAIWSGTDLRNDVATIYNNGEPTDLNNNGLTAPTTWSRMGDNATWNGATWTMTDVNGGYTNRSINMVEANRTTDVPPNPFVNTLSTLYDGVDDRINFASTITFSGEFSVNWWMKPQGYATNSKAFIWGRWGSNTDFLKLNNNSRLVLQIGGISRTLNRISGGDTIDLNVWSQICLTRDSSNNIKAYVNGNLFASSSASTTLRVQTIGRIINNGFGFLGAIDEVSFFNRELNSSEITTIYNGGLPSDVSSISGIIHWYRCGDGDTSTTITDNIGSNNATMINFTTFSTDVPTFSTKSIALDGVDDYVDCGNDSSLQIAESITVSAWFKTSDNGNQMVIAGRGHIYSTTLSSWVLFRRTNNGIGVQLRSGNSFQYVLSTSNTYNDGQWHNVIFTRNISSGNLKLYVDGLLQNTTSGVTSNFNNLTQNTTIGADTQSAEFFSGLIDEVAIFNSELSASDATSIYNGGVPNDLASLSPVSWWRCGDGDTSPTLTDNGSGGNDGTMTNFTTFSTDVPT